MDPVTPTLNLEPLRDHLREVSALALAHVTAKDLSSVFPMRGSDACQTWHLLLSDVGQVEARETIRRLVREEEQRREQIVAKTIETRHEDETFAEPATDYAPPAEKTPIRAIIESWTPHQRDLARAILREMGDPR